MQFQRLVANNQLFALLAKLLEGGKSLLIAFVVLSFYSTQAFGTYSLAIAIGSIFAILAEFRLMGILIRMFSRFPTLNARFLHHAMLINLCFAIIGIVVLAFSVWFIDSLLYQCLMLYSLSFLFKFARCFRAELLTKNQNNKVALAEVISGGLLLMTMLVATIYQADIRMIIAIRALDFLLLSLLFMSFSTVSFKSILNVQFSKRLMGFLVKKSMPLVLSGAAMIIFQRVDLITINAFWGTEQAGVYAAASTIATVFALSAMVFSESLAPQLFKKQIRNEQGDDEFGFSRVIVGVGALMSMCCLVLAPFVVEYLLSDEYQATLSSLLILSFTPLLTSLGACAGQVIIKRRLERFVFRKSLLACVITILVNLLLVPFIGIEGGAIATVIGLLFANYLSHWLITELRPIFRLQNQVLALSSFPKTRTAV